MDSSKNKSNMPNTGRRLLVLALVSAVFAFPAIIGIPWLTAVLLITAGIAFFIRSLDIWFPLELLLSVFFVLAVVLMFRLTVLDFYHVPSASMQNTLQPGDRILVSKLQYGPRMPQGIRDIPWLNVFADSVSTASVKIIWPYKRLSGISGISMDDIVVFRKSAGSGRFLVKRCVGLPGKILSLHNDTLFVDHKAVQPASGVRNRYEFTGVRNSALNHPCPLGKIGFSPFSVGNSIKVSLSRPQLEKLLEPKQFNRPSFDSLQWKFFCERSKGIKLPHEKWTVDHFGPFMVPKKGVAVLLDSLNVFLYLDVIRAEQPDMEIKNGSVFHHGRQIRKYTFNKNYYFFLGDNRHNSNDSRYWGFVAEELIEGKVVGSLRDLRKMLTFGLWSSPVTDSQISHGF